MKLFSLFGLLQLDQSTGSFISFELDKNGNAGEKYDQQLVSYLSRFDMDEDDAALTLIAKDRLGSKSKVPPEVRKIRQLKVFIISQMDKEIQNASEGTGFGRYCYYGCHCLPDRHHNEYRTFGEPVDKIDLQCKIMGTCYDCLSHKYGKGNCQPEETSYAFKVNDATKEIDCSMNTDPCKRDVCECDRQFAINVGVHQHSWNVEYHIKRSGFDRYAECRRQKDPVVEATLADLFSIPGDSQFGLGGLGIPDLGIPSGSATSMAMQTPSSEVVPQTCCNLNNFPDVFVPRRLHSCCGRNIQVPYNTITHQCCDGEVIFKNEVCD